MELGNFSRQRMADEARRNSKNKCTEVAKGMECSE